MGLLGLFRSSDRDTVHGTRILVCAFEQRFAPFLEEDAAIYRENYSATEMRVFSDHRELSDLLDRRYDVIHMLCEADVSGIISGLGRSGTELIYECCDRDVKLLWIASDNDPQAYIGGFNASGKHINLVMTIKRNGTNFTNFLRSLLSLMQGGERMPVAWNHLCPQIPGRTHQDAPESIFFAGRGRVRLL